MKNNFSALFISLILIFVFALPLPIKAAFVFADSFQNGFNSSWIVPIGLAAPVSSQFGITGEDSNNWSVINYPIINNGNYEIHFDLKINQENTTDAWGVGTSNDNGAWKFTGNWGQQLQIHDSSGSDKIVSWDHSLGIHHFDIVVSTYGNTPFAVSEDGVQLYSLTSIASFDIKSIVVSIQGNGDYELANFSLSTYEEPTPTPTPEPTVTPTPSPTSTPSPTPTMPPTPTQTPTPTSTPLTPTPTPSKKVVFLHGMGGSWNADALLNCKSNGYAGSWSPWTYKNFDVYAPVISALQNNGYEVLSYQYDWRQTTNDTAQKLKQYIEKKTAANESFYLVGHSFGGLVGREYINIVKDQNHIDKFLTVGTPHQGSVFAYPAWTGGEMWLNSTEMRLGFTIMKIGCSLKRNMSAREMVTKMIPSIQNLLPIFDYLKNTNGQMKSVTSLTSKNNWLPDSFTSPYYGIHVGTLNGTGFLTLKTLEVKPPSRQDTRLGNWIDGQPTDTKIYGDGDGTVLTESSTLPNISTIGLPLDHTGLVTHQEGIDAILNFLNEAAMIQPFKSMYMPQKNTVSVKNSTVLFIAADDGHFTLTDKDGNKIQDSEGQITILDPKDSVYTFSIVPTKRWWWHKTRIVVVQLFEDGTSKWKEYTHIGGSHRHWKLRFDRKHRYDDVLRDK